MVWVRACATVSLIRLYVLDLGRSLGRVVWMADSNVILYVCDKPHALGIRFILSIAGYSVLVATSGSALKQLRRYPVALLLVDQALVTADAKLPQEMKRLKPDVPIAVLVGSLSGSPLRSSMADLLVAKETEPSQFLAAVTKALTRGSRVALEA